ncbi:hypothetical protein [Francisella halioticida]
MKVMKRKCYGLRSTTLCFQRI